MERLGMRGLSTSSCICPNSLQASQKSSHLSLFLSHSFSPPLCQTDDRMWREGLERRDSWRWKDNSFWNAIALLTFGDSFVLVCVFVEPILISRVSDATVPSKQAPLRCCDAKTGLTPESHTRPDRTGFPLSVVQNFSMQGR